MTRKLSLLKIERSSFIILASVLLAAFSIQQQHVLGSSGAFDQGYQNGRNDYIDCYTKDPYCDPDNGASNPDAFCATYKAGYEAGWLAASLLYGN